MTDIVKFTKLMMLTTSPHDGEALVALRKANAMLAAMNNNWEDFIQSRVKMTKEAPEPSGEFHREVDEINDMFEYLDRSVPIRSSFREFVDSLHEWWEENEFLTDKQYIALKNACNTTRK